MSLIIAVFFGIFALYKLELAICFFTLGMVSIPHNYWNNLLIFYSLVFFVFVYLIQVTAKKRELYSIKNFNLPLLFFIFFGFYGVLIATDFGDAIRVYILLLSGICYSLLILVVFDDYKKIKLLIDFICISILFTGIYAILQKYVFGVEIRAEFIDAIVSADMPGRIYSTLDNPNNYSMYLLLALPICIANLLNTKSIYKKILVFFILSLGLFCLYFTLSRGAYISFAGGLFIFLLLVDAKVVFFGFIISVILLPIIISKFSFLAPDILFKRLSTVGKDSSSSYRILIWKGAFATIKDYFIRGIGIGPNSFKIIFRNYADPMAARAMHSHNIFLQVWFDTGILGFISFLTFLYTFFRDNFSLYIKTTNKKYKILLSSFIFSIASFLAYGMVEYVWYYPRVMTFSFIIIGLSFAMIRLIREEQIV